MRKLLLGICALTFALAPVVASARTHFGILGNPTFNTDSTCFTESSGVVRNTCNIAKSWTIPILWDSGTPADKTVRVTVHRNAGSSISCSYVGLNKTGGITFNGAFPAFTTNGFSTKDLTVTSVPGGSFGEVFCSIGPNSTAGVLGVDYFTP